MEVSGKGRRNTMIFALMTLLVIAFTLVASTWQILRQQEEVSSQHLAMGARSIAQAVESSYRRHGHTAQNQQSEFWPRLEELFTDVETGGDIQFIEIFDERGLRVIAALEKKAGAHYVLTPAQLEVMNAKGEWFSTVQNADRSVFVYAYKLKPIRGMGRNRQQLINDRYTFIVVGMSIDRHRNMYERFRQNAFLQSLYILAAAVFVWALALSLLSRRALIDKTRYLERFQAELLDNMPDALITMGQDGHIQSANPMAHEILNFEKGSLVGKHISDLPGVLGDITKPSAGQELEMGVLGWEQAEIDGKQLEILTSSFKGEHEQSIILLLIRNRTRVHNLERSLAAAEKMAAVGTLAAGVAHEIRNPLAALRGFAQYFAKKFAGKAPDEEFANTMVREADRLNRVITDLLYLARSKAVNYSEVGLSHISGEVETLLRFDLQEKNTIIEHNFELEYIWADEDAVKQALLNLMLNSLDAVSERREQEAALAQQREQGVAACAVHEQENVEFERSKQGSDDVELTQQTNAAWQGEITLKSYRQDKWAVLEIADNGVGMNAEQKIKAFEAFFTSKAKGTGLGLALVQKTLHEHGGHIVIDSQAMQGCTMRLHFPYKQIDDF